MAIDIQSGRRGMDMPAPLNLPKTGSGPVAGRKALGLQQAAGSLPLQPGIRALHGNPAALLRAFDHPPLALLKAPVCRAVNENAFCHPDLAFILVASPAVGKGRCGEESGQRGGYDKAAQHGFRFPSDFRGATPPGRKTRDHGGSMALPVEPLLEYFALPQALPATVEQSVA
ncbi:MAG: hypothetical protein R3D65_07165 [Zhengella sp.]|uniref:hypothetical protein n=1 Tax=Zhengella sp. TaxID=2282762 RepID=UPI00352979C8